MPSNSEKIRNLLRVPSYGFDNIPQPHSGSSQASIFPSFQKKILFEKPATPVRFKTPSGSSVSS